MVAVVIVAGLIALKAVRWPEVVKLGAASRLFRPIRHMATKLSRIGKTEIITS